ATLMISESDNTATDLLMDVAGRARVDEALGLTDVPSTREVFARWAAGGTLPGDRPLPPPLPKGEDLSHPPGFATYPVPLDTLCRLMDEVAPLDLMAVGPGPVLEGDWARVAFKGGSLPGVLNLTAGVTDGAGRVHCVALTVNDPAGVDAARTTQAFRELLAAVGGV
nr:class A beta-lactamase-related serine hydrolase [Paracoccaceae bacterium]